MIEKHLKKLLIAAAILLVLLIGFLVAVAIQPDEYRVARSTSISAPPEVVFAQVNDFHRWDAWSPWAKIDPNVKNTFEGPAQGQGAVFKWSGNDQVGEGSMTILDSKEAESVHLNLAFIRPFPGNSEVVFSFKAAQDQTQVTWAMTGKNNFVGKAFCMFMNMDKMLGGEFEKGLSQLKRVSEESAKATPTTAK